MHASTIMMQRDFRTRSEELLTIALRPCVLELELGSETGYYFRGELYSTH